MKIKLTKTHGYSWGEPDIKTIFEGDLNLTTQLKDEEIIDKLNEHSVGGVWWEKVDNVLRNE